MHSLPSVCFQAESNMNTKEVAYTPENCCSMKPMYSDKGKPMEGKPCDMEHYCNYSKWACMCPPVVLPGLRLCHEGTSGQSADCVHAPSCSRQQRVPAHADWRHHCVHRHVCGHVGYCNRKRYSQDLDVLWLDGGRLHRTDASTHNYVGCICTGGKFFFSQRSVLSCFHL